MSLGKGKGGKKEEVLTIIFPSKYGDTPIIPMDPEADAGGLLKASLSKLVKP